MTTTLPGSTLSVGMPVFGPSHGGMDRLALRANPGSRGIISLRVAMPEISRFFGIVIRMFYNDHTPAHFHATYGEREALIEIETLGVYRGGLPRRAMALVLEWALLHRQELRRDWELARSGQPPEPVAPLE